MDIPFKTSSYTAAQDCVEAGLDAGAVLFRDSKFKSRGEESPVLGFSRSAFFGLRARINSGALDR